jgi:hypothetical protein
MNIWKWIKRKIHKWTSEPDKVMVKPPEHPMCRCDPILKISSEGKDVNYKLPDYDYKNDVWRRHGDMEILSKVRHKHFLKINPDLYTPIYEDVKEGEYDD